MNLEVQEQIDENDMTFSQDEIKYAEKEVFQYVQDGDIVGLNEYLMSQYVKLCGRF